MPLAPMLLALALAGMFACHSKPPVDEKDYANTVAAARSAKDAELMSSPDVIAENRRGELLPLAYFAIDPDYSVPAVLKPSNDRTIIQMSTSTGTMRQMRRVGTLEFTLKGQPSQLTAFVEVGAPNLDHLFLPFMDFTTGTETYPGGRYIDLDRTASGVYDLDFNKAYHPYCFFNSSYDCPYPPTENRLKVPIRAGERLPRPNR